MSEGKHTPGNWVAKWSKYREGTYLVQTEHPSNRVIASFDDDGDGAGEQSIADAYLIAAAPDLFEAAKAVIRQWDTPNWKMQEPTAKFINALRQAVAKAEGSL